MGDFDKVSALALDAINSDPADWNGYLLVANANIFKKKFPEAEKYITEGQRLFPDRPDFDILFVKYNFHAGKYERVIQSVKTFLVKYPRMEPGDLLSFL